MARPRGSSRGRTNPRKTSWGLGPGDQGPVVITGSGNTILGNGAAPSVLGATMVRIRGQLGLTMLAATAIGDGYTGAVGVGVVTASAFAIGPFI